LDYAHQVAKELKQQGIRVKVDERSERMNAKIRDAQNQKIPFMLVVGDKEMESAQVAVRLRNNDNSGPMSLDDFIRLAKKDIEAGV